MRYSYGLVIGIYLLGMDCIEVLVLEEWLMVLLLLLIEGYFNFCFVVRNLMFIGGSLFL